MKGGQFTVMSRPYCWREGHAEQSVAPSLGQSVLDYRLTSHSSPEDADRRRRAASWCASTEVAFGDRLPYCFSPNGSSPDGHRR
jgi:hypothetical protein